MPKRASTPELDGVDTPSNKPSLTVDLCGDCSEPGPAGVAAEPELHAAEMRKIHFRAEADVHRHEVNIAPCPIVIAFVAIYLVYFA
jgi:hypothetical protein